MMVNIINQSEYAQITRELQSEIEEQVLELGDAFSGPVVIRDIADEEGRYFVISCGQVWSTGHGRVMRYRVQHRINKSHRGGNNYCSGNIYRTVAEAFIPNNDPEHNNCINHKDEIKYHDYVVFNDDLTLNEEKSNLEWCTIKYNCNYGTRNARMSANVSKALKEGGGVSGENNPNYGKHWSADWKKAQSERKRGKQLGPKSPQQRANCATKKYRNKFTGHVTNSSQLTKWVNQGKTIREEWELVQ